MNPFLKPALPLEFSMINGKKELLNFNNISVSYADTDTVVLENISLVFSQFEHIAIVGKSGAGKTTLLRRIYKAMTSESSLIHQDYSLVSQLSVYHNIYMGKLDCFSTFQNLLNLVRPNKKQKEAITHITNSLHITDILFHRVSQISGGQQQRTAIARTLYRDPLCILADEPVSSIDRVHAKKALQIITESSKTTIASMHNIEYALEYFQRIIGLKDRKILFDLFKEAVTESLINMLYK